MKTRRNSLSEAIRLGLIAGAVVGFGAGFSGPLFAQEEDQADEQEAASEDSADLGRVSVTGSRIQRPGLDTFYPAITVDSQLLQDRAFTNIADALNEIPTFGNPDNTPQGTQNAFAVGQNFVDFLGLGAQRTLTLVNGRRFVSANTPILFGLNGGGLQVDFNVIPVALVDRVEVVGVGGAPIYGSDAIAGTINVILKDRYEGAEFTFRKGFTSKGDGEFENALMVAGASTADGRGNVTFSAEWFRQEGLLGTERPAFTEGDNDVFYGIDGDGTRRIFRNQRINIFTPGGLLHPVGAGLGLVPGDPAREIPVPSFGIGAFPDGTFYQFAPNGNLVPFAPGAPGPGSIFFALGGDGQDFFDEVNQIQSPVDRGVFTGAFNYDLNDYVRLSSDFLFSDGNAVELSNQGGFQTGAFSGTSAGLVFDTSHPFLTDQARQVLNDNGVDEFVLSRFNNDIIDSRNFRDQQLFRVTGALDGEFYIGNQRFNWEVYGVHNEASIGTRAEGIIDGRFLNAIDVIELTEDDLADIDPSDLASIGGQGVVGVGDLVCRSVLLAAQDPDFGRLDGNGVATTNRPFIDGCIPLDIFGVNAADPAARDWVTGDLTTESKIKQTVYNFNIGGDLIELPAGALGVNIGYERRREDAQFRPGLGAAVPLTRSAPFPPTGGTFDTDEYFAEGVLPIFGRDFQLPGFYSLEINGAVRDIDNSLAGSATVWSFGGQWKPIEDLTIRGNLTESIRAPSLVELFTPVTQSFSFANDPCDSRFVNNGPNPDQRRANCIAAGVDPDNFTSNIVNATAIGRTGGNDSLLNEEAEAWSVGFTWEPRWVDNLIIGADHFDIELNDAILNLDLTSIMTACFDSSNFQSNPACDRFTRDDNGQVVDFLTGFTNAQSFRVEVEDFFVDYRFGVNSLAGVVSESWGAKDLGMLRVNTRISRDRRRQNSVTGEQIVRSVRSFASPKYEGTLDLTWARRDTRVFWRTLWQNRALLSPTQQNTFENLDGEQVTSTSHRFISNLSITQALPRWFDFMPQDTTLQLNVNNVLRRTPNTIEQAAGHFTVTELLGRTYALTLQAAF